MMARNDSANLKPQTTLSLPKVLVSVRSADIVIRYGGEEFIIIMPDTIGDQAMLVAEKIRSSVESLKIQLPGAVLSKTISISLSEFPGDCETFWHAIKYADVALYHAKDIGRNRVIRFTKELWTEGKEY